MTVRITRRPLSVGATFASLAEPASGGIVLFVGCVRPDRRGSRRVVALDYEADPRMATGALRRLEREARRRFPVRRIVLAHRVGLLPVGTPSVIVGVAAAHRRPAFDAARFLIDRLKREVPIWKTATGPVGPRPRKASRG